MSLRLEDAELAALLEVVGARHGLGVRAGSLPAWMSSRLRRAEAILARRLGVKTGPELIRALRADAEAVAEVADLLRVGETSFYRDPPLWAALRQHWARSRNGRPLRALSVGCSSGEEVWTLSMVLEAAGVADYRVLGFDRSELAIETARAGLYSLESQEKLPQELRRFLLPEAAAELLTVEPTLRRRVGFLVRDAVQGPPAGSYQLILCRNLLIYFSEEKGGELVRRLLDALTPGGWLVVARSEVSRLRELGHQPLEVADNVRVFRSGEAS